MENIPDQEKISASNPSEAAADASAAAVPQPPSEDASFTVASEDGAAAATAQNVASSWDNATTASAVSADAPRASEEDAADSSVAHSGVASAAPPTATPAAPPTATPAGVASTAPSSDSSPAPSSRNYTPGYFAYETGRIFKIKSRREHLLLHPEDATKEEIAEKALKAEKARERMKRNYAKKKQGKEVKPRVAHPKKPVSKKQPHLAKKSQKTGFRSTSITECISSSVGEINNEADNVVTS